MSGVLDGDTAALAASPASARFATAKAGGIAAAWLWAVECRCIVSPLAPLRGSSDGCNPNKNW
jgi:hypothetical protein